ncbi:MAG: glycosyl hydrolase family 5 [Hyphomicrobium sp.]
MRANKSVLVLGAAVAGAMSMGQAFAADFGPPPPPPPAPIVYQPVYQPINYRCVRWTAICDRRWGLGSPRFVRCMWRHGC